MYSFSQKLDPLKLSLIVAMAALGCGGSASDGYDATVQGAVTIDGELAKGGTVTFFPVAKGPAAVGMISPDGSYSLRVGKGNESNLDRSKIPAGDYVATVTVTGPTAGDAKSAAGGPLPLGPALMADKYMSRDSSDLKHKIKSGMNIVNLKLDGPWANPAPEEAAAEEEEEDAAAKDNESANAPTDPADDESATPSEKVEAPPQDSANEDAPHSDEAVVPAEQSALSKDEP